MIFEIVNAVLGDLDDHGLDTHDDEWEDLITEQLAYLEGCYGNHNLLNADRELIDYGSLSTQAAYVFMYMAGHADFIYQILVKTRVALGSPLFSPGELKVTCLGGGPGSEAVGLTKYLLSEGADEGVTKIVCSIYDKEGEWVSVADITAEKLRDYIDIDIAYRELDVTDTAAAKAETFSGENLLILSFFISEISVIEESNKVITSVNHLLKSLDVGSRLLYNDSKTVSFLKFFKNRIWAAGRYVELHEVDENLSVSSPNLSDVIEEYMNSSGRTPKLNSNAVAKFYKRTT